MRQAFCDVCGIECGQVGMVRLNDSSLVQLFVGRDIDSARPYDLCSKHFDLVREACTKDSSDFKDVSS